MHERVRFRGALLGVVGALGVILAAMLAGPAWSASAPPPQALDCEKLPCAEVAPAAARFRPAPDARYWLAEDANGEVVGWVALSTDFVDIKAYSGKPMITLVGIDRDGVITGAKVVHHSEPILLVGIPEAKLHEFVDYYAGKPANQRIVVGRSKDPEAITVDAISGATVTVLAQNHTILEVARRVGVEVGVLDVASISPGRFIEDAEPWSFDEMLDRGALGHLLVTEKDMGVGDSSAPFVDLYFGIADAPHIGRPLIGKGDYDYYMRQLEEGEHLLVVLSRGSGSFKGSGFVRGGVFDRVRVQQGLREISFRDADYYNLPDVYAEGAPEFAEGAVFVARGGLLDPGAPYDLIFLGSRYDHKSAYSREFREFKASHALPASVYWVDRSAEKSLWEQAWYNRAADSVILVVMLTAVMAVFLARRYTTADPTRIKWIHRTSMLACFLVIGVYMHAQPSVTQILTAVESIVGEWRWELFLSEPLIFILWIFIGIVSVIWGRGVFCGWVCPYGAMTEILFLIGEKLGIKGYELPDAVHLKLRYLRYAVLFALIPIFLWDSVLGERMAEVEPFKSTFLVPAWSRSAPFLGWWIVLLAASLVMYRPFCRYLCPLGGGLALLSSFRPSGPRRRNFCTSCKICTRGCEPRAIRPDGTIDPRECLSCMDCEATYRNQAACPPLIAIQRLDAKPELTPQEREKRVELEEKVARV